MSFYLPLPALRLVAEYLSNDPVSHVHFSRVDREVRAFYMYDFGEEGWRTLLARYSLGKSFRHTAKSWYELACGIVGHNATCRLCKMLVHEMRFQYIERHDPESEPDLLELRITADNDQAWLSPCRKQTILDVQASTGFDRSRASPITL
jgi:hypothetical protein